MIEQKIEVPLWRKLSRDYVTCCKYCNEIIQKINTGDDILYFCQSCQMTEGETYEIHVDEYEARP